MKATAQVKHRAKCAPTTPADVVAITPETVVYKHATQLTEDVFKPLRGLFQHHDAVGVSFHLVTGDGANGTAGPIQLAAVGHAWPHQLVRDEGGNTTTITPPTWAVHDHGGNGGHMVDVMRLLWASEATKVTLSIQSVAHHLGSASLTVDQPKIIDLELFYEHFVDSTSRHVALKTLAQHCGALNGTEDWYKHAVNQELDNVDLGKQQLPSKAQQRIAKRAELLLRYYMDGVSRIITKAERQELREMSERRWASAQQWGPPPLVWFDVAHDFIPRCVECFGGREDVKSTIPLLALECKIESLLELLPRRYRDSILSNPNARDRLVAVCLDIGRTPHGYVGHG